MSGKYCMPAKTGTKKTNIKVRTVKVRRVKTGVKTPTMKP